MRMFRVILDTLSMICKMEIDYFHIILKSHYSHVLQIYTENILYILQHFYYAVSYVTSSSKVYFNFIILYYYYTIYFYNYFYDKESSLFLSNLGIKLIFQICSKFYF